jgi:hypothetical protein
MMLLIENTALILIAAQAGLDNLRLGRRSSPEYIKELPKCHPFRSILCYRVSTALDSPLCEARRSHQNGNEQSSVVAGFAQLQLQHAQLLPHFADSHLRHWQHFALGNGPSHGEMSQTGASNPDGTAAICANSQESPDSHSYHISHLSLHFSANYKLLNIKFSNLSQPQPTP